MLKYKEKSVYRRTKGSCKTHGETWGQGEREKKTERKRERIGEREGGIEISREARKQSCKYFALPSGYSGNNVLKQERSLKQYLQLLAFDKTFLNK